MSVLGLRCAKDKFAYVVVDGTRAAPGVVDHGVLELPAGTRPAQLTWVRQEILELCQRHGVTAAAFKAIEATATGDTSRGEVEGVAQQALHDAGIDVDALKKNQCKSRLELGPAKGVFDAALKLPPISSVPTGHRREAMAVALAALDA